jgi:queuine/archaeosine tRNA-ribosyltransferase
MDLTFYPAQKMPAVKDKYLDGRLINYTHDDALYKYDKLLVSYHYGKSATRDQVGKHVTDIIGDSGGFQAVSMDIDINPVDVIEWQNNYCDIGITLDMPPIKIGDMLHGGFLRGKAFEKCMNTSNNNANIMMSKKSENLKLYLVIQGYDQTTRQTWLDKGREEYDDWDGYAIASKPQGNPYVLIDSLKFAIDNDLKNIHILGVSGKLTIAILAYFGDKFDSIKYDSSSFQIGRRFRRYMIPGDVANVMHLGVGNKIPKSLPCDCPFCSKVDDITIFFGETGMKSSHAGEIINMHNLYTFVEYNRKMISLAYDTKVMLTSNPKLKKLFEYAEQIRIENNLLKWV